MTAPASPRSMPAIDAVALDHVSVVFGDTVALRDVSFSVKFGERVLLTGPNGAGKSTLLRLMAGLLRPSRGAVLVAGRSPFGLEARRQVGVMLHNPWLDPDLTVIETLRYFARLFGVSEIDQRIEALLGRLGMASRARRLARELSRGYQQRLSLARALLHDPRILLLDEPDTGLDDASRSVVGELLCESTATPRTVLMSSHNLAFGQSVTHRTVALEGGSLVDLPAEQALEPARWE